MLTFILLTAAALSPLRLGAALSDHNDSGSWEDQDWGSFNVERKEQ